MGDAEIWGKHGQRIMGRKAGGIGYRKRRKVWILNLFAEWYDADAPPHLKRSFKNSNHRRLRIDCKNSSSRGFF